jgi:hypothetical protein
MFATGGGTIGIVCVPLLEQAPTVMATLSVTEPEAPAENAMDEVVLLDVIVPFVIDQRYDAPG